MVCVGFLFCPGCYFFFIAVTCEGIPCDSGSLDFTIAIGQSTYQQARNLIQ